MDSLYTVENGRLSLHFHDGQRRAWDSSKRFVVVLAGTQGGKTSFGPHWLYREIQRRGPGDYMVVTPTFTLLEKKALPEFLIVFKELLGLGKYVGGSKKTFTFSVAGSLRTFGKKTAVVTKVFFGHAGDPDSLESATAKAAWLDEAGQRKFKGSSYEAILRRLSLAMGRVLITTTIYQMGWIKKKLYDLWMAAKQNHPTIDVISFPSTANPMFPKKEAERAKRDLPKWKFRMFYLGQYTKPAGLIYDNFDDVNHVVPRFPIPLDWPRFVGVDFGGVNTAAVFKAKNPANARIYTYRTYHRGGLTARQHAKALKSGEGDGLVAFGGARSEGQWRREFRAGGLVIRVPVVREVEIGIDRVYAGHASGKSFVFDDLTEYLEEKGTYSRVLDEDGEPTEQIEDKSTFHLMDSERYIDSYLFNPKGRQRARSRQG